MYLVGLQIYCKMIHGPYNIKLDHEIPTQVVLNTWNRQGQITKR